jgi:DNA repair exonuclease SbcCD ATPase subunit
MLTGLCTGVDCVRKARERAEATATDHIEAASVAVDQLQTLLKKKSKTETHLAKVEEAKKAVSKTDRKARRKLAQEFNKEVDKLPKAHYRVRFVLPGRLIPATNLYGPTKVEVLELCQSCSHIEARDRTIRGWGVETIADYTK